MKSYREDCNHAKAARAGIVEQRPVRPVSKKAKPIVVEYRLSPNSPLLMRGIFEKWTRFQGYRTMAEAEKAMADQLRKHPDLWDFRIKE